VMTVISYSALRARH